MMLQGMCSCYGSRTYTTPQRNCAVVPDANARADLGFYMVGFRRFVIVGFSGRFVGTPFVVRVWSVALPVSGA
jgi:hypothetical protein